MDCPIKNTDDVLDSRDVIRVLESFESDRESLINAVEAFDVSCSNLTDKEVDGLHDAVVELKEWYDEYWEEYKSLKEFVEEAEKYASDWSDGATLIHESHFEDYCQKMAEDLGDIPKNIPSYIVIDWSATADNLRHDGDYTEIEWDGETYLVK